MAPYLALLFTCCFIAWLLRADLKFRRGGSLALLIPGIWLAIAGTRPVSSWFMSSEELASAKVTLEGNPINTLIIGILILAALIVLNRRSINWGEIVRTNQVIFLVYFYFALSSVWSLDPFTSLKRLMKDFGSVPILMIFLTEEDPSLAVRTVFVRLSYIIFPLSILCGRYFPSIGRGYGIGGEPMFTGLSDQKNSLGQVAMVFGLMIIYDFLELRNLKESPRIRKQKSIDILMLLIGLWILIACNSKTSLICLMVGTAILLGARKARNIKNGRTILIGCLSVALSLMIFEKTIGVSESALRMLGRDPTLTGRSLLWETIKAQIGSPILGEGFSIFWNTPRGEAVADVVGPINTAHNGYLEMYLDGGLFGETLIFLMLFVLAGRSVAWVFQHRPVGEMGLIYLSAVILHNCSETSFFRLSVLWFAFLLSLMEAPNRIFAIPVKSGRILIRRTTAAV